MKKITGIALLLMGVIFGIYSLNMRTVTVEQANENLSNSFASVDGSQRKPEIYNPELLNERTNYLIASGFISIIGIILIVIPEKRK